MARLQILAILVTGSVLAAGPSIELEKAVVDPSGIASLNARLVSTGMPFTAAQMDILGSDQIAEMSIARGADLDASKTVTTRILGTNAIRVLIYGINKDQLRDGAIVGIAVKVRAAAPAGSHAITVSEAIAADGTGHAVSLMGEAGAAIVPGGGVAAPVVSAVANAASYSREGVAPGEIVVIGGGGLAATAGVVRASGTGTVGTTLGGVRVLFDGVPAPLLYASATQVAALVPYALDGRTRTQLQVESQGVRSMAATVPVARTAPGIFTVDQSGTGQGAVVNQDGTLNGSASPAAPGSIVAVFGTGEGQTAPAGVDGMIVAVPDLRKPLLPVSATIGGVPAEVMYAGSAPEQVSGLFQVNVRVPPATAAGAAVSIAVKVGDSSSQAGVTIAVR